MIVPGFPGLTFKELFDTKQSSDSLPFPLNPKYRNIEISKYYYFARNGIFHGLRYYRIQPGDEVLMPELNSTIEPQVVRALGGIPVFYKIKTFKLSDFQTFKPFDDFTPDWDDVASKLTNKTKFFHLIHYLGVPNDIERSLEFCDKHHLIFFEDAAYGFLSKCRNVEMSTSPLGSFGDFSILCPRKTVPVPNGGVLVINNTRHETRDTYHETQNKNVIPDFDPPASPSLGGESKNKKQKKFSNHPLSTIHYPLQASYSSLWDWQYLLRNSPPSVIPNLICPPCPTPASTRNRGKQVEAGDPETKNKKSRRPLGVGTPTGASEQKDFNALRSTLTALRSATGYVFHGSGSFDVVRVNWGMTKMAQNQLSRFDYPTIIQKNLANYEYVRDFCINRGWDIFPREIQPGTVPNAILLRTPSDFSKSRNLEISKSDFPSTPFTSTADHISQIMLSRGVQLARPWHWNENLTTSRNLPSVDAYVGRGLVLPTHYQLTRDHLDYYLSLLSRILVV